MGPSFVCGSSDDSDAHAVDAAHLQQEGHDIKEFFHGEPADSPQPLTPAPLRYSGRSGGTIGSQTSADPDFIVPQEGHDIKECGGTE